MAVSLDMLLGNEGLDRLPDFFDNFEDNHFIDTFHQTVWWGQASVARRMLPRYQSIPLEDRVTRLSHRYGFLSSSTILSKAESMEDVVEAVNMASSISYYSSNLKEEISLLTSSPYLENAFNDCLRKFGKPFDGDLPMVDAQGLLHHSELAQGLRSLGRAYPQAYDDVLCWIADEISPDELPGARFERKQLAYVTYNDFYSKKSLDLNLEDMTPDQWREIRAGSRKKTLEDGTVIDEIVNIYGLSSTLSLVEGTPCLADIHCLKTMAPPHCLYGFEEKKGYTLSRVSVSDILALPQVGHSKTNEEKTGLFLKGYLPLPTIIAGENPTPIAGKRIEGLGISSLRPSVARDTIKALDTDPKVKEKMLTLLPEDAWKSFISPHSTKYRTERPYLNGKTLINAWKHLGWDNTGFHLDDWSYSDISALHESDFVFSPDTRLKFNDSNDSKRILNSETMLDMSKDKFSLGLAKRIKMIRNLIDMNIWPVHKKEKPADIYSALRSAALLSNRESVYSHSLNYLLEKSGPETCCALAKTDRQWETLSRIFGDRIGPFMGKAPAKVRSHTMNESLGL